MNLEDRLRKEFSEASIPPPSSVWDNIHDALLRDEVKESSVLPPPVVWDRIQAALPITNPWYVKYRWGLAAALLLFSLVGTFNFYQSVINPVSNENLNAKQSPNNRKFISDEKEEVNSPQSITKLDLANAKQEKIISNTPTNTPSNTELGKNNSSSKAAEQHSTQKNVSNASKKSNVKDKSTIGSSNGSSEVFQANNSKVKTRKAKQSPSTNNTKNRNSASISGVEVEEGSTNLEKVDAKSLNEESNEGLAFDANYKPQPIDLKQVVFEDDEEVILKKGKKMPKNKYGKLNTSKGFYVSPMAGIQYNTMSKTAFDFDSDFSSLERKPSYGAVIGLGMGYDINERFAVMAEWIYSSSENQKYTTVREGKEVDIKVALDYMKFPLVFKYKHGLIGNAKVPMLLSFNAGLHYSMLRSRNTFINGELEYFDQKHNQRQWGALAGLEVDVFTSKQLYFTFGSRVSYSASTEAFKKREPTETADPLSFQTTIYTRLNFKFLRKNTSKSPSKSLTEFE